MKSCTNCLNTIAESDNYCSHCGQSTKSIKKPVTQFLRDGFHELLDIDGRVLTTLRTLFLNPGLASLEFSQGRRLKYTPPLRLYLVVSLVFFLVLASFDNMYSGEGTRTENTTETYSRIMFVLFPVFALYLGALFRQSYFIANLVFSIHLHTMAYLVLLLIGTFEAFEAHHVVFVALQFIPAGYFLWYVLVAFKTMFQQSWLLTITKAAAVYFVYMATLGLVFDVVLR